MSQDISIKEGGLSQQFGHINKLKVPQSGGGDTLWVPEDEVQTDTLYVDKNGTYDAHTGIFTETITKTKKTKKGKKKKITTYVQQYDEDLLCYGWDEVHVNIVDSVTGKGSDGNLHNISVGDNDMLQDEKIPSYIKIITPPDRTSYIMGEVIDTKGMVVKAYYEDDTEYGEIPRSDYTLNPIVAEKGGDSWESATSDLIDWSVRFGSPPAINKWEYMEGYYLQRVIEGCEAIAFVRYGNNIHSVRASSQPFTDITYELWGDSPEHHNEITDYIDSGYTYNGKTVYYTYGYTVYNSEHEYTPLPNEVDKDFNRLKVAWTMIYGDITIEGGSKVDVNWEREDGEILTDSFNIEVRDISVPSIGGDSDTPITPPSHGEMQ